MRQALAPLFSAAVMVAACYSTGALVAARSGAKLSRSEKIPLSFLLGAACVHLMVFAILALHIAYKPILLLVAIAPIAAAIWSGQWKGPISAERDPQLPMSLRLLFGGMFAGFTVFYFVNAWVPESSPDGSGYHLELLGRYARMHGFEAIHTNMYAGLSEGIELVFFPAFVFGRHSAAALVHLAFTIALALSIFAYGKRIGKPVVGAAAALLVYISPIVGRDGTAAYIDVGTAAVVFAAFYWLQIWDEERIPSLMIPAGLMAGYAFAAKYTAFVMAPYAVFFVAWRARKLRPALVLTVCALTMIAPWLIKNWVILQNPISPLGNQFFRNPNMQVRAEQDWSEYLRRYGVENKWMLPVEAIVRGGNTQGVLGLVFLAAPLALLALYQPQARRLMIPAVLLLATYLGNVGTRFLIPALPFFALSMALALENVPWLLALLVVFHALTSTPAGILTYANQYAWRLEVFPLQAALRKIPEDQYLRQASQGYVVMKMVDRVVPPGERVLAMSGGSTSYSTHDILTGFQAAFNSTLSDALTIAYTDEWQPTRMLVFHFTPRMIQRIRLLQTAQGKGAEEWRIHELRFFSAGKELPRSADWRLRAFPNGWDVQLAFDNSLATRWRSWEAGFPGMYVDADFGRPELVDEVRMETSREYTWPMRIEVQTMGPAGEWIKIGENPEERAVQITSSLRRAATYEMNARGIHYLLIGDTDYGADDFADDPEAWGFVPVAREANYTLYKVAP